MNNNSLSAGADLGSASVEGLQAMADLAPLPVWLSNAAGDLVYGNPLWTQLTGADPSQSAWLEYVHPQDRAAVAALHRHSVSTRTAYSCEYRLRADDGSYRWLIQNAAACWEPGGDFSGMMCYCTDLTAHKEDVEALRKSEQRFRNLLEASSDWYWEQDEDFRFTYVTAFARTAEKWESDLIGKTRFDLSIVDLSEDERAAHQVLLDARLPFRDFVIRRRDKHGELHYTSVSGSPIFDARGVFTGYRGVSKDVTEERIAERDAQTALRKVNDQLLAVAAQYKSVIETLTEAILVCDANASIIDCNEAATEAFGLPRDRLIGASTVPEGATPIREDGSEIALDEMPSQVALRSGRPQKNLVIGLKKGDSLRWRLINALPVTLPGADTPTTVVISLTDITDQKHAVDALRASEQRMQHMARHDPLTNLPNRLGLQDRLQHALALAERVGAALGVLYIDLDRFKTINDSLGHSAGDQLLQQVALRMAACLRESDTVARLGGDEFVVVIENVQERNELAQVATKILDAVALPCPIDGHEVFVTPSIGITVFPEDGKDMTALLRNADLAMYRAKELGRSNFQFYSAQGEQRQAAGRLSIESKLRRALERDEFTLVYQPQVDLTKGHITGVEALIRWNNSELGTVAPNEFIPIAEEKGLILPIGRWALQQACRQARAWQSAGLPPMTIAVNLSGRQFLDPHLPRSVREALESAALDPHYLELEITESVAITQLRLTIQTLGALRDMGVAVALDDFGTGYSSLAYLRRFPISALKVDRQFVMNTPHDQDSVSITQAIIAMAKGLKLDTIAEGVETHAQIAFLRDIGCSKMQGYVFSRPLPPDQLETLVRAHRSEPALSAT